MEQPVQILYLEDSAPDVDLVQGVIESAGIVCQLTRVQTGDEFRDAVRNGRFDIILADYCLPMYNGMSALRLVQELNLDVPFIFVSGTMGEDAAIEGLTQGATDYVLKQKLLRLAPAVKRALRDAGNRRERNQAEAALRESHALNELLLQTMPFGLQIVDQQGKILFVNSAWEKIAGLDTIGRTCSELHKDQMQPSGCPLRKPIMVGETITLEIADLFGNRSFEVIHTGMLYNGQKVILQVFHDITDRKHAEKEREQLLDQISAARDQLKVLSQRLVQVQEHERRHIARELHDEIGQSLTGLKLLLEMNSNLTEAQAASCLADAQAVLSELIAKVRDLSLDLRPAMLDDLGLVPALLWYFERYTAQTQIRVLFKHTGVGGRRFGPDVETAAYRIIQEALTNVARHAGVAEVTVRLWVNADVLSVQVEDKGTGFDLVAARSQGHASGVTGMRERAILLGGNLTIESAPGKGTCLTAELPESGRIERRQNGRFNSTGG